MSTQIYREPARDLAVARDVDVIVVGGGPAGLAAAIAAARNGALDRVGGAFWLPGRQGVIVENKSGRQVLLAPVVIDASGDGDVAARAGVPFWQTVEDEAPRLVDARIKSLDCLWKVYHSEQLLWQCS